MATFTAFRALSKNLIGENDEFKKRCCRDERPAHTPLYRFLLGTRATTEPDAVGFSNPLVSSTHREPSLYL
jgi:hypothetical protein